jgi:hypothetical protein
MIIILKEFNGRTFALLILTGDEVADNKCSDVINGERKCSMFWRH